VIGWRRPGVCQVAAPGSVQPAATGGFDDPLGALPAVPAAACLAKQLAVLELLLLLLLQAADGQARGHQQGHAGHYGPLNETLI